MSAEHPAVPTLGHAPDWTPSQDVIATLLPQLIGEPSPSATHRKTLEICAHAYVTSESLLRALLGEQAPELFAWLRAQPYIESTALGLFPHDVVRETLVADLRWRDPEGFAALHKRLHQHLFEQLRAVPSAHLLPATGALLYLYRTDGHMDDFHDWNQAGLVYPCAVPTCSPRTPSTAAASSCRTAETSRRCSSVWWRRCPASAGARRGMPFSTYRRHLTSGVERVAELLWQHELSGTPLPLADAPHA